MGEGNRDCLEAKSQAIQADIHWMPWRLVIFRSGGVEADGCETTEPHVWSGWRPTAYPSPDESIDGTVSGHQSLSALFQPTRTNPNTISRIAEVQGELDVHTAQPH